MRRDHLLLAIPAGLTLGLWLSLPALALALGLPGLAEPGPRAGLAAGALALLAAALEIARRGAESARLQAEMAELRRIVRDAEEEVVWARRELKGLVEALRHRGAPAEAERTLEEARAEVRLLQSVVTQLDGPAARTAEAAPGPAAPSGQAPCAPAPAALAPSATAVSTTAPAAPTLAAARTAAKVDPQRALAAVREALKHDRIELVLQPIVSLPQRRRRFFECFSRLRDADGQVLLPESYIPVAERAGLMAAIDNMLLLRCVQLVRRIQRKGERLAFVCNLSPRTLDDRQFFGDFVDYLDANAELAAGLVFEIAQADFARLQPAAEDYLLRLWTLGARLSVDGVEDLAFDPAKLAARHVDFVKIPAAVLLAAPADRVARLRQGLAEAEIDLVAEKIESDEQLVELLELGLDYGQGYLFGEPRPARLAA